VNRPFVLDSSAVVALFDANPRVMTIWRWANLGENVVAIPATVLVHASQVADIAPSAWEAILYPLTVMPLDSASALGVLESPERLDIAHTAWEADLMRATVVTRHPASYRLRKLPVLSLRPDQ